MHKDRSLFFRLARANLERNRVFYLPYAVASAVMAAMFFIVINTIYTQSVSDISYGSTLSAMLFVGCVVMAAFTFGYMFYINSFLIKRRKKEFGLYAVLGLEKRHVSRVIFTENILLGSASLAVGLVAGTVFGRLAFLLLGAMVRYGSGSVFELSPVSYLITTCFFGLVFIATALYNQAVVRLADPVELLRGGAKGERPPRGVLPLGLLGFACLAGAYWFSLTVKAGGLAVAYFWPAVVLVIVGVNLLFRSGSQLVLAALKKNDAVYYRPQGFITISGLTHRLKQNAAGLANICILCTMVLVTISGCCALYFGQEGMLKKQHPDDCELEFTVDRRAAAPDLSSLGATARTLAAENGVTLDSIYTFRSLEDRVILHDGEPVFKDENAELTAPSVAWYEGYTTVHIVTLADYNAVTGGSETLSGSEIIAASSADFPSGTLDINGARYNVKKVAGDTPFTACPNSERRSLTLAASDWAAAIRLRDSINPGLAQDHSYGVNNCQINVTANATGDPERCAAFYSALNDEATRLVGSGTDILSSSMGDIETSRKSSFGLYGGLLFMGILFSLLFLTNTVVIMYFKQVGEGFDDRERFVLMQKVGMSDGEVRSTIDRQVLIVFMLPLAVALLNILAASNLLVQLIGAFAMTDLAITLLCISATALLFAAVYAAVFRATAKTYYKLVKW